jgi:hypothetical protein
MADRWRALGTKIGAGLGTAINGLGLGDAIRSLVAAKYGVCRVCKSVLGGASPEQICEECHASEMLAAALGKKKRGGPAS